MPKRESFAFIGFGEAGQAIGGGLVAAGAGRVTAYDPRFNDPHTGGEMRAKATECGIVPCPSAAAAAEQADVIVSAVAAGVALQVAETVAGCLHPSQVFLDLNSVSPSEKRAAAKAVEAAGADYVEAAVLSPVGAMGHKVPMLFAGPSAERLAGQLQLFGMNVEVAGAEVGVASAVKMCRSIVMKGMEALAVESLLTAHLYGVEERVLASLERTFPSLGWRERSDYMIGRVLAHGARRAEEMRCAAETVRAVGLDPIMADAIARRQRWVADLEPGHADSTDDAEAPHLATLIAAYCRTCR